MSSISVAIPPHESITDEKEKAAPEKSANKVAGYRISTPREDAACKCLLPAFLGARGKFACVKI